MQRYLVAINYDGPHERLAAEMRALALADDSQIHVVVPAVARGEAHSEGEQRALAQQLLSSIESALAEVTAVDGDVGDANVFVAIGDELDRHPYDVLVIATPSIGGHDQARLVDRLVRLFGLPVIHVTATDSEWLASQSSATVTPFPSVTATESDFTIHLSVSHVAAGPYALVADNRGPSAHAWELRLRLQPSRPLSARDARRAGRAMNGLVSSDANAT